MSDDKPADYRTAAWSRARILAYADRCEAEARRQGRVTANALQAMAVLMERAGLDSTTVENVDLGARTFDVVAELNDDNGNVTLRMVRR